MIRIAHRILVAFLTATAVSLALALELAAGPAATAQQPPGFPSFDPAGPDTFGDSRDRVETSVVAEQDRVAPGADVVIAVILQHQPGWHSWTNKGNVPEGMAEFGGAIHTEIKVETPEGSPLQVHEGFIQWPEAHAAKADIGEGPQEYAVFSGRAIAYVPVTIKADAPAGEVKFSVIVSFQTCNDSTCLAPADAEIRQTLQIVDAATLASSPPTKASPADFAKFDASVWAKIHSGAPAPEPNRDGEGARSADDASATTGTTPRPTFFGAPLPRTDGALGLVMLILLSMLGGFILNLTPCVLPIIPIKILTISQHAGTPGRTFALGVWMALGVVAFWIGIGIPAAFVAGAADPSRVFGIWWLTLAIGLIIGAMGVGIMGLFAIQLPTAVYAVNPKTDTPGGSFLFGVMTAVLGLPCFGFIAGALLVGSATMPPALIVTIFASIGIGMAAPYLVLAAKPGLVERIPRTGPASELVKHVMGLLLLAAAAYFVGSGLITLVIDRPYLGKQLHWWVVAVFAMAAGLWLAVRTFQITRRVLPRGVFTILGLLLGSIGVLFALDRTEKAQAEWQRLEASRSAGDAFVAGAWNDFTPERFQKAREAGHIVVLDFTASWCLTCQVLKATVLDPEPVRSAFEEQDVVVFTVDLSSLKAPGWNHLRSLGKTGIPLLAIYTPGVDQPWDANAYTADQVLQALDRARHGARLATSAAPRP